MNLVVGMTRYNRFTIVASKQDTWKSYDRGEKHRAPIYRVGCFAHVYTID